MISTYRTGSEEETRNVAHSMARDLARGDVVALHGDLGSGKTQFVKGLCEAFRVREPVTSPTFVILNRYSGLDRQDKPLFIFHFDLYRIQSSEEIYDLGYEEFLFGNGICVIEWAERLDSLLPGRRVDISMEFGEKENDRTIAVRTGVVQEKTSKGGAQ